MYVLKRMKQVKEMYVKVYYKYVSVLSLGKNFANERDTMPRTALLPHAYVRTPL